MGAFPRAVERRRKEGVADEDKPEAEVNDEVCLKGFERNNTTFTIQAEEAIRELIDFSDELAMQSAIMKDVVREITSAPAPRRTARRRRRDVGSDDEEEEEEEEDAEPPAADPEQMSALELLRQAKEDHATKYASQSKRSRYGDNNDYKIFKQILHDAQNPNSGLPVAHPSTWFPEENDGNGRRGRNDDESDEEVIIASASESLKCPLTLRYYDDPVTNQKCKHTIDRAGLVDYHRTEARVFQGSHGNRRVAKCPQTGCDAMLALDDYERDELMARKVKRALNRERLQQQGNDDDDDIVADVDEEDNKAKVARIKRERARSRGLSMAPPAATMDSDEEMSTN